MDTFQCCPILSLAESSVPGYDASVIFGAFVRALAHPDVRDKLTAMGNVGSTPGKIVHQKMAEPVQL